MERVYFKDKEIILVGTAHISQASIDQVKKAIEDERPDCVGVELDAQRFDQLKQGAKWRDTDLVKVIKEGKGYLFLLNILLVNIQRQLGDQVGVKPGEEMLEAVRAAEAKNIPVALLDRDVRITMKRAMAKMSAVEKFKLLYSILLALFEMHEPLTKEKVEELKQQDTLNALLKELGKEAPAVKQVLVDERDQFIANKILAARGKKIVAVVGAGHIEGIKKHLGHQMPIAHLNLEPTKNVWMEFLKFVVPLAFLGVLAYGLVNKGLFASLELMFWWALITGSLSALGVLLARGHPISILTAFVAAPFTTLHPALAAGWFAGLAEARIRIPLVKDFEELNKLNSLSDLNHNRVTHILMVTALANVGSTIGTIVAFPYLLSLLA